MMESVFIIIFVFIYWAIPWDKLPALLRGTPWFLLAALFNYLGEVDWVVRLFIIFGVTVSIFYMVKNQLKKFEDKKNET